MCHHDVVGISAKPVTAVVDESFSDADAGLVEEHCFGGTCHNAGCIPSRELADTAYVAPKVRQAGVYDVDVELKAVGWREARDRVFGRLDAERDTAEEAASTGAGSPRARTRPGSPGPGPSGSARRTGQRRWGTPAHRYPSSTWPTARRGPSRTTSPTRTT